jgi:hypothetical protein
LSPDRSCGGLAVCASTNTGCMSIPTFDSVRDIPLTTDEEVAERLGLILATAIRRQIWLMFLDDDGQQLPAIIPTYVPARPRPREERGMARFVKHMADELGAATVLVTFERRAGTDLTDADRVWLRSLRSSCEQAEVAFRGPFLCHREGVRVVAPEEYLPEQLAG